MSNRCLEDEEKEEMKIEKEEERNQDQVRMLYQALTAEGMNEQKSIAENAEMQKKS